jgi:glucosyl-3-phosphoglycerate synthase
MEYVQERVATLHDFDGAHPDAPTDRAAVVVPLTERDHASLAAERVLGVLETVDPGEVIVALRASESEVGTVAAWLGEFDLDLTTLWCNAPPLEDRLREEGLDGDAGKGRDVWLALGLAARRDYVVVHDADATTYSAAHVPRLLFPLAHGYGFSKGYYARVENDRLYGRLCRLFYEPLVRGLDAAHGDDIVDYLGAFRYALAGEFAATSEVARRLRAQRGWGLEVGTLGEAFAAAGFAGSAQVDLGIHEHDHRAVSGPAGLGRMCEEVGAALFHALEDNGVSPDYDRLPGRYREAAEGLVEQYAADAAFNGLEYDRAQEREQVAEYATAIAPPGEDRRLPAWVDAPIAPETVAALSADGIDAATQGEP